ncbi:MAG: 50S ribosomal protein L34e [Candidatus Aenigmatarchaeota archaeon]
MLKRKTPSGKITIIIKKRKGDYVKCAICKRILNGVVKEHPRDLSRINKTQKTVSRIYGGYLCHKCLEKLLKSKIREKIILKNI